MNPNSENGRGAEQDSKGSGVLKSMAQAESLMQIAFVLPCAMLAGWGMGWCADHFLHWRWAQVVGLILGIVAGMVSVIRTATQAMHSVGGRERR